MLRSFQNYRAVESLASRFAARILYNVHMMPVISMAVNYRHALPIGFFPLVAAGVPIVRAELPEIEAAVVGSAVGYCLPRLELDGLAQAMPRAIAERDLLRGDVALLNRSLSWEKEAKRLRR